MKPYTDGIVVADADETVRRNMPDDDNDDDDDDDDSRTRYSSASRMVSVIE
jgi:hypothetical protein